MNDQRGFPMRLISLLCLAFLALTPSARAGNDNGPESGVIAPQYCAAGPAEHELKTALQHVNELKTENALLKSKVALLQAEREEMKTAFAEIRAEIENMKTYTAYTKTTSIYAMIANLLHGAWTTSPCTVPGGSYTEQKRNGEP